MLGMRRWRRPYQLTSEGLRARISLLGVVSIGALVVHAVVRTRAPVVVIAAFLTYLGAASGLLVRQAMVGVSVNAAGIRSRSLVRTEAVLWRDVADIRSREAMFAGVDLDREAIFIELAGGRVIQTPLQRGRRYAQFDVVPSLGRLRVWPDHYDEILQALRDCLREARGPAPDASPPTPASSRRAVDLSWPGPPPALDNELHVLVRKHERGELTDAEFDAAKAALWRD